MTETELFAKTRDFITLKPACNEALSQLKKGKEIRLILDGKMECACFNTGTGAGIEQRPATNADVEFKINSEAVRRLAEIPGENLADTGVEVLREVLADNIEVKLVGSVKNVLTDGYVNIMRKAGPDFFAFLAQKGLTNIFKVIGYIKKMKKR